MSNDILYKSIPEIALQSNTIKREQPAGQGQVARLMDENVRSKL